MNQLPVFLVEQPDPLIQLIETPLPGSDMTVGDALDYLSAGHEPAAEVLAAAGITYTGGRLLLHTNNPALSRLLLSPLLRETDALFDLGAGVLSLALDVAPDA